MDLKPYQTSKMKRFVVVNYFHKTPLSDVLQRSEYTSENEYIWFKLSSLHKFSRIWTEYGDIRSFCLCSVRMRENADQKNSKYGLFSRSLCIQNKKNILKFVHYIQSISTTLFYIQNVLSAIFIKTDVNFTVYGRYQGKNFYDGSEINLLNVT